MLKPVWIFLCSLSLLSTAREVSISGRVMCDKSSAPSGINVYLLPSETSSNPITTSITSPNGEYNVTGTVDDSVSEFYIQVIIDCSNSEALKRCWSVYPGFGGSCPKVRCFYEIVQRLNMRNLIIGNFILNNENVDVYDKGKERTCQA
ncbi:hypothetical protein PRIPAC_73193 [Pristionchus pacificus]|uniref:Uncharacterized protein n=1 Tax=Pristionchus pacificus TaxID=54126 RepID=A0A454XU99_PRIPA|nr:hypothetical protein PRIPAC_73193 [Pristionchus pacificus]|eukprot:PDM74363.1 hypothetical protein PRIPAC_41719 [Pristionchus pacificus]